jgi:hypothetical protein
VLAPSRSTRVALLDPIEVPVNPPLRGTTSGLELDAQSMVIVGLILAVLVAFGLRHARMAAASTV